ncbi:AAA family ATPase [Polyangium sp. 6x1]|uniref:AAA family ATPase n=1 Tax=Polyangium sp. 6x1 TaxID=3042689 RepID=UPI002482E4B2|nr:AAA family ATPase [Polyangium sp. 6x1]MDI1445339.1 AAA family ATPase [Polyangium sp. 6x1]
MYIRKILIENIRCFDRVELDLTRSDGSLAGWTVLAGRNGTGKSTLLKAIALAVAGPEVARSLQRGFDDWLKLGAESANTEVQLDYPVTNDLGDDDIVDVTGGLRWQRSQQGPEPSMHAVASDEDRHLLDIGPWHPVSWGCFTAAYGPFRRIGFRDNYQPPKPLSEARLESLFDEDVTLAESIHWLKDVRAVRLELEDRARRAAPDEAPKLEIQARKQAELYDDVLALLNDGLLPDGVRVIGLDMQRGLLVEQGEVERPLRSLSDGYRAAIALVLDIVRQMYRTFPGLFERRFDVERRTAKDGKERVQIPYEGIVLIDEVDAHLHVSWQQRIGFWLKEHFPNVQFIVTTHSPFVCQAADPKGLIRLPVPGSGERVEHVSEDLYDTVVNGDVDDAVMTALFGLERTHSDEAEALRSRVAKLQAKMMRGHATPEEKEEMKRLSARLPKTGSALVQQTLRKLGEPG